MTEAVCIKITPSLSTSVIPAIGLTLNTKCSVEGNGLFIVLKAEVFCRELDGVSRLIGFHVDLQTLCSGVVSRFYFNGDKLTVTRYYKHQRSLMPCVRFYILRRFLPAKPLISSTALLFQNNGP